MRLADLWLDGVTSLPSGATTAVAWSRAEWVEATLPVWKELVDPVAERVGAAHGRRAARGDAGHGGPAARHDALHGRRDVRPADRPGRSARSRARSSAPPTSACRWARSGKAALLPAEHRRASARAWASPPDEVRLYLALREAAHHRLFAHVPWLRSHLFGAVEGYARGIKVDTSKLEDVRRPAGPVATRSSSRKRCSGGMFQPEDTPEQKAALARLETALALVEGWVDAVVHEAAERPAAVGRTRCARPCGGGAPPAARRSRPSRR